MDECPVCMEELSNVTTRVTTQCCNNVLHLKCLRKCKYKCPLCRNDDIELDIPSSGESTPLLPPIIVVEEDPCKATYNKVFRCGVIWCFALGGIYYATELFGSPMQLEFSPPPPPY